MLTSSEGRGPDHHGRAAAVLTEELLLVRAGGSGRLQVCQGSFVPIAPLCRCQIPPAPAKRDDIFTTVFQHVEKRVIGLDNLTLEIPHEDSPQFFIVTVMVTVSPSSPAASSTNMALSPARRRSTTQWGCLPSGHSRSR